MKHLIIALISAGALLISSCSGNKADQENADSLYQYSDTGKSTIDTNSMDSVHAQKQADTIMNAPKMPGRDKPQ